MTPLNRRGFLALTGGVAATAALAACGGSGSDDGLRLVGVADQQKPLDELTKAYGKVKFNASYAPTDQVQTSVRTQLGAGNAPDIHVVYPGNGSAMSMVQISDANLLADLSDQAWTQKIPQNFKPAFQNKGKTYIYAAGASVIGAVYNKKVFAEVGIQQPPTTWPEFLALCDKLKQAGKVPIALGAQTPWVTQLITYALVPSTVYVKNPDFDKEMASGKATFADSGWVDALEMYLDLQKRGYFNDNPNGTTFEQQTSMVATGKAAMAIQVSAVLPDFRKAADSEDDLSMFPLPGAETADQVWVPAGIVVGVGVSARSKKQADAKKFVEFLGEQKNINAWAEAVACVPLVQDASSKIDPVLDPFLPYMEGNKAVPFMDQAWPNAEVQPAHFAVVQELLGGKTTIPEALAKLDQTYGKS
jgi:raffinose/stachyose/melibiose transport system substrate-binding protein